MRIHFIAKRGRIIIFYLLRTYIGFEEDELQAQFKKNRGNSTSEK